MHKYFQRLVSMPEPAVIMNTAECLKLSKSELPSNEKGQKVHYDDFEACPLPSGHNFGPRTRL